MPLFLLALVLIFHLVLLQMDGSERQTSFPFQCASSWFESSSQNCYRCSIHFLDTTVCVTCYRRDTKVNERQRGFIYYPSNTINNNFTSYHTCSNVHHAFCLLVIGGASTSAATVLHERTALEVEH